MEYKNCKKVAGVRPIMDELLQISLRSYTVQNAAIVYKIISNESWLFFKKIINEFKNYKNTKKKKKKKKI